MPYGSIKVMKGGYDQGTSSQTGPARGKSHCLGSGSTTSSYQNLRKGEMTAPRDNSGFR